MFELSLGWPVDAIWAVTFVVFSSFAANGIASSAFSHRHERLDVVPFPVPFHESSVAAITQPHHRDAAIRNRIERFIDAQHQLSSLSDLLGEPRAHWTTRV